MRKLYEIFKILQFQKRIVSAETIRGNTVFEQVLMNFKIGYGFYNIPKIIIKPNYFKKQCFSSSFLLT